MKKMPLIFILLSLIIISCGVPQADFDLLKKENEQLKLEIANCQLTPKQLLEQANEFFEALEYEKSKSKITTLTLKFPNSEETKQSNRLLRKVEKEMKETAQLIEKGKQVEDTNEKYIEALSKMRKRYDMNKKITWYYDKTSPKYNNENGFYIYLGKKEKRKPWLGLSINHFSKDWLFIQQIIIDADGQTYTIEEDKPGEFKANEENDGNREWVDRIIKKDNMDMLTSIATSKTVKIKYVGKNTSLNKTLTTAQKKAIANVLDTYQMLGGTIQ